MNRRPVFKRIFALLLMLSLAMSSVDIRAHAQSTQNGTIGYQGELNNGDLPAEGLYDFEFTLWDAAGTPIGQPVIKTGVEVLNGRFSVDLDFGSSIVAGAAYRLEVAVRNAATSNGFAPISTNFPLWVYAPIADSPLQAAAVDAVAYGQAATAPANALYVAANGNTGVGITTPLAKLHVAGNLLLNSGGNPAIFLGTGTVELNRYLSIINSPQKGTAGGLKTGGLLVADSYAYANPAKNNLIVKGSVGIGTTNPLRPLHVKGNTELVALEGTTHAYIAWYPDGPATRQAIVGFGTSSSDDFSIENENVGDILLIPTSGNVGIGTREPLRPLHVKGNTELVALEGTTNAYIAWYPDGPATRQAIVGFGTSSNDDFSIENESVGDILLIPTSGNVGIGTREPQRPLHVKGNGSTLALEGTDHTYIEFFPDGPQTRKAFLGFRSGNNDDLYITNEIKGGKVSVNILAITGGSDLAEPFAIADADTIEPGMVVAIDPDNPGQLQMATAAYDRTVAGVVSGAGGINPGLILQQEGSVLVGSHPVALTGRVYVYADTSNGAIQPGDLLTTSSTPGHAMKVTDHEKAQGAILGKAMSKLEKGAGLVLVLVTLQ